MKLIEGNAHIALNNNNNLLRPVSIYLCICLCSYVSTNIVQFNCELL